MSTLSSIPSTNGDGLDTTLCVRCKRTVRIDSTRADGTGGKRKCTDKLGRSCDLLTRRVLPGRVRPINVGDTVTL